jgi:hypothetical protein
MLTFVGLVIFELVLASLIYEIVSGFRMADSFLRRYFWIIVLDTATLILSSLEWSTMPEEYTNACVVVSLIIAVTLVALGFVSSQ